MGSSFHNQESMVEVTSGLRFGSVNDDQNSTPGTGDIINIGQEENRDDDSTLQRCNEIDQQEVGRENDICIQQSSDFEIVEVQREGHISSTNSPYV